MSDPHTSETTVGVVGLGYWGPNLLRVMSELEGTELRWMCERDPERLERFARRHPTVSATSDLDDLLADDDLDAILIATPVFTHFDLGSRALEAGKHVFVEKPLAQSVDEADRLVALAEARGVHLMCGHTFLYSPAVSGVKAMLDAEELGKMYFVSSSRVNLGLHQRDVSVIWDLGPHDFSILLHWFGEVPATVRAVGRDSIVSGVYDVAFITLTFPSGLVASVELSWLAPSKLRRTVLVGSEKMVVYEDGSPEPIRVFDHGVIYRDPETFGEYHLSYRTGNIVSPKLESYEPLARQLDAFTSAVRDNGSLLAHTKMARDVVQVTEAADRSLREGGAEVLINRPMSRFRRSTDRKPLKLGL